MTELIIAPPAPKPTLDSLPIGAAIVLGEPLGSLLVKTTKNSFLVVAAEPCDEFPIPTPGVLEVGTTVTIADSASYALVRKLEAYL